MKRTIFKCFHFVTAKHSPRTHRASSPVPRTNRCTPESPRCCRHRRTAAAAAVRRRAKSCPPRDRCHLGRLRRASTGRYSCYPLCWEKCNRNLHGRGSPAGRVTRRALRLEDEKQETTESEAPLTSSCRASSCCKRHSVLLRRFLFKFWVVTPPPVRAPRTTIPNSKRTRSFLINLLNKLARPPVFAEEFCLVCPLGVKHVVEN